MVWSVTTHEHRERSTDWYWGLGLIAIVGAGAAVFFSNVLLAVIVLLGLGSIGFLAARGPREHLIKIDARGLSIDGTRHPWESVVSFWVEHETDTPRLFLSMKGALMPFVSLDLDNREQGDAVRSHLAAYAAEVEQGPHLGERLAEIFGL